MNKGDIVFNDDKELVLQLKKGEEAAFRELFMKYGKKLYNFSKTKNLTNEDAEGVVQDVFVKIWEGKKTLNEELSFNSYIITIAKNLIYNKSRKELNRRLFEEYLVYTKMDKHNGVENQMVYEELRQVIMDILKELPMRARVIFTMNRFKGMNNQEIADKLGISKKTVENQMYIALKHIRGNLVGHTDINFAIILTFLVVNY